MTHVVAGLYSNSMAHLRTLFLFFTVAYATAAGVPTMPVDWQAHESSSITAPGQYASWIGTAYWDRTHNRTSYISDNHQADTYYDYAAQQIFHVAGTMCLFYCDMLGDLQCNLGDSLCPYDYEAHGKMNGTATVNGVLCDRISWPENLGPS